MSKPGYDCWKKNIFEHLKSVLCIYYQSFEGRTYKSNFLIFLAFDVTGSESESATLLIFIYIFSLFSVLLQRIAEMGMERGCPVLSNDSDFFVFDVDFVRLDCVDIWRTKAEGKFNLNLSTYRKVVRNKTLNQHWE